MPPYRHHKPTPPAALTLAVRVPAEVAVRYWRSGIASTEITAATCRALDRLPAAERTRLCREWDAFRGRSPSPAEEAWDAADRARLRPQEALDLDG